MPEDFSLLDLLENRYLLLKQTEAEQSPSPFKTLRELISRETVYSQTEHLPVLYPVRKVLLHVLVEVGDAKDPLDDHVGALVRTLEKKLGLRYMHEIYANICKYVPAYL